MRNAMRDNRVRVKVYVHQDEIIDRVASSEEGLETGRNVPTELHDPEGNTGGAAGVDLS